MNKEQIIKLINENELIKFYNCRKWRNLRKKALERDNNECQRCKRKGKVTLTSLQVHHKKEVKTHPQLALSMENLETLCIHCHNDEHDRLEINKKKSFFINEERW
ncbi:HNH endonuclease [Rossellomorea sp. DUT-2]|uniref:HNH endonuclease n=1 Tax=Rossellomorea sp. DUT-2 TaxID=3412021 RepID=UPI003D173EFC